MDNKPQLYFSFVGLAQSINKLAPHKLAPSPPEGPQALLGANDHPPPRCERGQPCPAPPGPPDVEVESPQMKERPVSTSRTMGISIGRTTGDSPTQENELSTEEFDKEIREVGVPL